MKKSYIAGRTRLATEGRQRAGPAVWQAGLESPGRHHENSSNTDFVRRFEQDGLDVIGGGPKEAAALLASEVKKWGRVIRERGMKAD